MTKTSVRIGAFEIDDAELRGEAQGERTLSIPCKSDPPEGGLFITEAAPASERPRTPLPYQCSADC